MSFLLSSLNSSHPFFFFFPFILRFPKSAPIGIQNTLTLFLQRQVTVLDIGKHIFVLQVNAAVLKIIAFD
jgi:hypothetical protein